MPKVLPRLLALSIAVVLASSGLVPTDPVGTAVAADAPWTLPTVPPKCTTAQKATGDVATCVITLDTDMPEQRGWPAPPFPDPAVGGVIAWVDLAKGSSGPVVAKVQQALIDHGATIAADGQFGPLTETAVKTYQTAHGLPATGIVDQATADSLGVQNTTAGTFPPAGWKWLGWGYNGSPALAQWEQSFVSNTKPIGSLRAGQLRAFPEALPLFEGFLAEIQARGYVIRNGGTYVFRCTASTRKDCNGLTRSSLSNHSYGLASDLNTAENPMRTYYGVNGATACQTPMLTDMPRWVIQVAEKWGLYWGGYGWSAGCSSPTQARTSVSRDPMHFEFNGTPEMAHAIWVHNVGGACIDVISPDGTITNHCYAASEVPGATTRVVVTTGAPAGATAALVNITAAAIAGNGYVTAEPCTAQPVGTRPWSNGNVRPGRAVASAAIVPIDAQGRFCLYQSTAMHSIVDVQGFFLPADAAPDGSLYTPVTAERTTDTRTEAFCTPDSECSDQGPIAAGSEIVNTAAAPVEATATLANITVVAPATNSYVTADACATLTPGPQQRSNVNFAVGDTVANLAVVPSATNEQGVQFCAYSPTGLQEIIDVQGFFVPAALGGLAYTPLTPSRLLDTRECRTDPDTDEQHCNEANPGGTILRLQAPAGAAAVAVTLTAITPGAPGYVAAAACAAMSPGPQPQSNVNAVMGTAVANLAVVPVDADGTFCVYSSSTMHLAVDLVGTFSPDGALRFQPVTPVRVHDSRQPL